jgi:hypothetical protein
MSFHELNAQMAADYYYSLDDWALIGLLITAAWAMYGLHTWIDAT